MQRCRARAWDAMYHVGHAPNSSTPFAARRQPSQPFHGPRTVLHIAAAGERGPTGGFNFSSRNPDRFGLRRNSSPHRGAKFVLSGCFYTSARTSQGSPWPSTRIPRRLHGATCVFAFKASLSAEVTGAEVLRLTIPHLPASPSCFFPFPTIRD
jgi:hypothetical protein